MCVEIQNLVAFNVSFKITLQMGGLILLLASQAIFNAKPKFKVKSSIT